MKIAAAFAGGVATGFGIALFIGWLFEEED